VTPVGRFRIIALVEGISFLVLLFIAMPIKYLEAFGSNPKPVQYVGWVHGVLYILYAIAGFQALYARGWGVREAVWGFLASILPGGTFVYDVLFLKREHEAEKAEKAAESHLQPPA
jgi:integral membrane protein